MFEFAHLSRVDGFPNRTHYCCYHRFFWKNHMSASTSPITSVTLKAGVEYFQAWFTPKGLSRLELLPKPGSLDTIPSPFRDWARQTQKALEGILQGKVPK